MSDIQAIVGDFLPSSTTQITGQLVDANGNPVGSNVLTSLTLTITAPLLPGAPFVNSVNKVNILNTGRGTIDVNGNLTIQLLPADMTVLGTADEVHYLIIEGQYSSNKQVTAVLEIVVRYIVGV